MLPLMLSKPVEVFDQVFAPPRVMGAENIGCAVGCNTSIEGQNIRPTASNRISATAIGQIEGKCGRCDWSAKRHNARRSQGATSENGVVKCRIIPVHVCPRIIPVAQSVGPNAGAIRDDYTISSSSIPRQSRPLHLHVPQWTRLRAAKH